MLVYKKCTKRQLDSTIGEIKTLYIFFLRICVLKRSHIMVGVAIMMYFLKKIEHCLDFINYKAGDERMSK